jgi:hypothetical protein
MLTRNQVPTIVHNYGLSSSMSSTIQTADRTAGGGGLPWECYTLQLELKRNWIFSTSENKKFHESVRFFTKVFAKILVFQTFSRKFKRKCSFSETFSRIFLQKSGIFVNDAFSKHCHVMAVLSRLPIGRLVQSDLSLLSCHSSPVPDVLSKTSCPDLSVLSRLSFPSCSPVPAALPGPHWPLLF